jgi:thiamine biosynthesis protein ThiS
MRLTLNGNISEFQNVTTVADLLQNLQIESLRVAVEVNLAIIKKRNYEKHLLKDGDSVEIVNFVGGG